MYPLNSIHKLLIIFSFIQIGNVLYPLFIIQQFGDVDIPHVVLQSNVPIQIAMEEEVIFILDFTTLTFPFISWSVGSTAHFDLQIVS